MDQRLKYFNQMITVLKQYYDLSRGCITGLEKILFLKEVAAGDTMLHYKEIQHTAWFQLTGTAIEIIDPGTGKEVVTWFWGVNDFIHAVPGFFSQQASNSSITALQDSRFFAIHIDDLNDLKAEFPEIENLSEKIRDRYKILKELHAIEVSSQTSVIRVKRLYNLKPELFKIALRKQLASFLRMDPDTLTRAIRKLEIKI